jgi:TatA/E family protein of Tat protein translocase
MGPVGIQEMIVIFLVALVLFGPKKLPELGRTIGKALTEFRRASSDLKATFEREMQSLERETQALNEETRRTAEAIHQSAYDEMPYYDSTVHNLEAGSETAVAHPSTGGASAVPGAESNGTAQAENHIGQIAPAGQAPTGGEAAPSAEAAPVVEGTVARIEAPKAGVATEVAPTEAHPPSEASRRS